jgi:hypothetical protein
LDYFGNTVDVSGIVEISLEIVFGFSGTVEDFNGTAVGFSETDVDCSGPVVDFVGNSCWLLIVVNLFRTVLDFSRTDVGFCGTCSRWLL